MAVEGGGLHEAEQVGQAGGQFAHVVDGHEPVAGEADQGGGRGDGLGRDGMAVDGVRQGQPARGGHHRRIGPTPRAQIVAHRIAAARALRGDGVEAGVQLLGRAVGGHGQLAGQRHPVLGTPGLDRQLQDAALDPAPGGGQGMGTVGGGDHHQLAQTLGEAFGEGQAHHAAVGAAHEGGGARRLQMVQQQGQQPGLIAGGDRQGRGGRGGAVRGEVEGQHLEAVQIDGAARRHRAGPPARAVGLGAVHEPAAGDAAGHDHQRRVGAALQAGADHRIGQGFAGRQSEIGGNGNDDVARRQDRRKGLARGTTHGVGVEERLFGQGGGHLSVVSQSSRSSRLLLTDRGTPMERGFHSSLANPKALAGVGTFRAKARGCPGVKGPIPRPVLMSPEILRKAHTFVK